MRAAWRVARLLSWCVALYLLWAIVHLTLLLAPTTRERWRRWIVRTWGRAVCSSLAVRITFSGQPPPPGSFVVCNHLSYLDIPVIAACYDTCFVSKSEVGDWFFIGSLARVGNTIYVERARKRQLHAVNDEIARALGSGLSVVVFPEGTSTRGAEVLPFRPSLLAHAAEAELDAHCMCMSYATDAGDPPASLEVCWWGGMSLLPHVAKLLQLRGIAAHLECIPGSVRDANRKRLAEKLFAAVNARFRPLP
jgi:1-acyl-sn-glycerol-3-phosphate acyltransferase